VGIRIDGINYLFDVEYGSEPYADKLQGIVELLDSVHTVVGFNIKFDLNWLARYGIQLRERHRVYDLQNAEFIKSGQTEIMPSLDECLGKYNLGEKDHTIETEYWSKGIDTPEVPRELLEHYLSCDLEVEDRLYEYYLLNMPESQAALLRLVNADLLVLQEMEYNGMVLDWATISAKAEETQQRLKEVDEQLSEFVQLEFRGIFNPGSGDHLSALLYGGTVTCKQGTPYQHTFKSGSRVGESCTRYRWESRTFEFPRLVTPIEGSELKKSGYWSTDLFYLRQLKKPKKLLELLLDRADLEKLYSTYYDGLAKLREKFDWQDGCLHGQFNQCVARTGRLSASNPNQQNFDKRIHQHIITRH